MPPAAAAALGLTAANAAAAISGAGSTPGDNADAAASAPTLPSTKNATWQRVVLLPGLELMICSDASPVVRRAAQTICAEYLGGSLLVACEVRV